MDGYAWQLDFEGTSPNQMRLDSKNAKSEKIPV